MRHSARSVASLATFAVLSTTAVTLANAEDVAQPPTFETTLLAGYGFGGKFEDSRTAQRINLSSGGTFGAIFNWAASEELAYYELAYHHQASSLDGPTPFDLSMDYLHIGGHVTFADHTGHVVPYFVVTIGATRFSPDLEGLADLTKFSAAIGGGAKFPLSRRFAIRADARLYASFVGNQSDVFCEVPDLRCPVHLHGETILQTVASVGATFRW